MDSKKQAKSKASKPAPITEHETYWMRATAKPKPGSRPMPSRGQLGG